MKICLVCTFPPSGRQLNEYAFHIARELKRNPMIELTILADELTSYQWATDENGNPIKVEEQPELPGFNVIRCWKFNDLRTPLRLLNVIRRLEPDVVWFNLVFSTFATQDHPAAAFVGLCTPALSRACGFYTHVTLHHILEHVDFTGAGVRHERLLRLGSDLATRALLRANSVSVLLSGYRRTLMKKYAAENVLLGTHGIFEQRPEPADFSKRGNPDHRILALGHWGTYKRLDTLIEAFPAVVEQVPTAKLIVAGANHHTKPGYWEWVRESVRDNPRIEFHGYVPEEAIPELYRTTSIVVMPYDSATGSSGPAHQACEYSVPIVCADIPDLRNMAIDEDMAVSFYERGNAADLAAKLVAILTSREQQERMAQQNFAAALRMTMPSVVRQYLRWFEVVKRTGASSSSSSWRRGAGLLPSYSRRSVPSWTLHGNHHPYAAESKPDKIDGDVAGINDGNGHSAIQLVGGAKDSRTPEGTERAN
jgi:glycosyltransferase involved in cell wall biosynthesis